MPRMETPTANFTHHFLIAMPNMVDPHFTRTLTYIAEHNEQGALGLIVNRPIEINLATLLEKIAVPLEPEDSARLGSQPVLFGGPVQTDRGFVLHRPIGKWQSTLAINQEIGLTSSRDILLSFASQGQPGEILVTLGYSGWGPGQIEQELAQNSWLSVPASPHILFSLPYEERLPSAMQILGIDFVRLAGMAGHA